MKAEYPKKALYTCIVCPRGCEIAVRWEKEGQTPLLSGQGCGRGEAYVRQELTDPRRTISSSLRVIGGEKETVCVRLTKPISLKRIKEALSLIHQKSVQAPVASGQVLIGDLLGLGSDCIAIETVEKEGRDERIGSSK